MPDSTVPRSLDHTPSSPSDSAAAQQPAPAQGPRSDTVPSRQLLSVDKYHQEYHRRHAKGSTSHGSRGSNAPVPTGSLGPSPAPRTWREELVAGEVDFDDAEDLPARHEAATSVATLDRQLRTPNPFPERFQSLCYAPLLPSRYDDRLLEPGVITNDLDGAQGRQLTAGACSGFHRPVARPLLATSRRDYYFEPFGHVQVWATGRNHSRSCRAAVARERFLTAQITTPVQYLKCLRQLLNCEPVPAMRTAPMVLAEGETTNAYEAQFQNWVERSRRLNSYDAI
ncbi:hypothetical protein PHMEG_00018569 [Phytophthora megakarya]|uniref:Uncharacterized protein n=1 Tax=Phytophthora megakarya TaxID=4795 RepID=A0A225VVA5_9STRA|nr:hypothetical protein PHMEG_00018569 [Phytophthora megakarya]